MNGFSAFYAKYPRHCGKKDAEKAWDVLMRRGIDPGIIIALLEIRIRNDWRQREPQYIPYPASWLRAEAFEPQEDQAMPLFGLLKKAKPHTPTEDEDELRARAETLQRRIQHELQWWEQDRLSHRHSDHCGNGQWCRLHESKRPYVPTIEEIMDAMRERV